MVLFCLSACSMPGLPLLLQGRHPLPGTGLQATNNGPKQRPKGAPRVNCPTACACPAARIPKICASQKLLLPLRTKESCRIVHAKAWLIARMHCYEIDQQTDAE